MKPMRDRRRGRSREEDSNRPQSISMLFTNGFSTMFRGSTRGPRSYNSSFFSSLRLPFFPPARDSSALDGDREAVLEKYKDTEQARLYEEIGIGVPKIPENKPEEQPTDEELARIAGEIKARKRRRRVNKIVAVVLFLVVVLAVVLIVFFLLLNNEGDDEYDDKYHDEHDHDHEGFINLLRLKFIFGS